MKQTESFVFQTGDQLAEQHERWDDVTERRIFVITDYGNDRGVTHRSVSLFDKVSSRFGKFLYAIVDGEREFLVLKDENGNELHLSGCSAGYEGTGPYGTFQVLNKAGFNIDLRFAVCAKTFELCHPDVVDYNAISEEK
jgi:hypothetical protein